MQVSRDENRIPALLAVLDSDGVTPVYVCSDIATNHMLCVSDGTTGSNLSVSTAVRDENRIPVAMAVSSVDGKTPVVLYANNLNELLVQST